LLDMVARHYSPQLGTFTSQDSVAGKAADPLSMNRFLYAEADPTTLIDPDGHATVICGEDLCTTNIDPATALAMNHETTVAAQTYCQAHPTASTCRSQSFRPRPHGPGKVAPPPRPSERPVIGRCAGIVVAGGIIEVVSAADAILAAAEEGFSVGLASPLVAFQIGTSMAGASAGAVLIYEGFSCQPGL
jgi:hypothetical protein